ncbi:cytochrome-c peroxidase [Thalassomonas actiniarum]|uniref:C-type cytochrome n=1 Tax=Thalassomonas actiniarum TaxID=485447 RepID=A0AAE9YW91_9GAMM|nr:cytochrome c peroxidase [Thalassomonas actiniarum]WDE01524.1 c-type cytochrome [Thalassomonas actiniarum]
MKNNLSNSGDTRLTLAASPLLARVYMFTVLALLVVVPPASGQEQGQNQIVDPYHFTGADIEFLAQFSLSRLKALPPAPGNRLADDLKAAKLGKKLFFDEGLSRNNQVSCRSCHQPELYFTDGKKLSQGAGLTFRSSPTVLGASFSPWQFWDGRKDSLWSQALGPIEDVNEFNTSRTEYVHALLTAYLPLYQQVFGPLDEKTLPQKLAQLTVAASPLGNEAQVKRWQALSPELQTWVNRVFSNAGKAMMAYERRLALPRARFDHFVDALVSESQQKSAANTAQQLLTQAEVRGLRLFVGKGNCASCHNGPLFTNYEFHNIGAPEPLEGNVELGRYQGVKLLAQDEFTCLSAFSDADGRACNEMRFLKVSGPELVGALKTPTLRNIAKTAPYMQFGQFADLKEVITHYNQPSPPVYNRQLHPSRPHFDILPLKLTEEEIEDLQAFLHTLTSPLPFEDPWWGLEPLRLTRRH